MWITYLISPSTSSILEKNNALKKTPSFFIHPFRNYKTTIIKAPMAHKTYSQEQFMIRYYRLSVSFRVYMFDDYTRPLNTINNSVSNFNKSYNNV